MPNTVASTRIIFAHTNLNRRFAVLMCSSLEQAQTRLRNSGIIHANGSWSKARVSLTNGREIVMPLQQALRNRDPYNVSQRLIGSDVPLTNTDYESVQFFKIVKVPINNDTLTSLVCPTPTD